MCGDLEGDLDPSAPLFVEAAQNAREVFAETHLRGFVEAEQVLLDLLRHEPVRLREVGEKGRLVPGLVRIPRHPLNVEDVLSVVDREQGAFAVLSVPNL